MFLFVVANFVGQDRFQFGLRQLLNEGVEQDNFSEATKAGKESIGMFGAFAAVHNLDSFGMKTGSFSQRQQPFAKCAFWKRSEFVEEWHDYDWRQDNHQQLKR